ncbi:hypothetical protein SCA6_004810 [Theobroma cacao]
MHAQTIAIHVLIAVAPFTLIKGCSLLLHVCMSDKKNSFPPISNFIHATVPGSGQQPQKLDYSLQMEKNEDIDIHKA